MKMNGDISAEYRIKIDDWLTIVISFEALIEGLDALGGLQHIDIDPERGVRVTMNGVTTQFANAYVALRSYWLETPYQRSPQLLKMCVRNGITPEMVFATNGEIVYEPDGHIIFMYYPGGNYTLMDVKWGGYGAPETHDFTVDTVECRYHRTDRAQLPGTHHRSMFIYEHQKAGGFESLNIRRMK